MKATLRKLISGTILFNEPMGRHTTFRIGGPADTLIIPHSEDDLRRVLKAAYIDMVPMAVIGNGSNLLVSDDGIDGIVVKISGCFNDVTLRDKKITAGAGCHLSKLVRLAADTGLGGLEFAVGIPGAIGGAVVMNAGTNETQIGDLVTKVKIMNHRGELIELNKKDLEFGYRHSALQGGDLIVLSVEMELTKGSVEEIKSKMELNLERRKKKQPIDFRSAGSTFKNPPNDYAGRIIEASGCKGMSIGGAQVSELHANFIINLGNATSHDVFQLMKEIRDRVLQKYGIELETEMKIIGRGISWKHLS